MKYLHHTQRGGFTLVEAIVSIVLLSFAVAGPMALSAQSLRATREARQKLVATHIAEEGIEVLHNYRDNNSAGDATLNRLNWMDDISTECSVGCVVDITNHGPGVWGPNAIKKCPAGDCTDVRTMFYHPTSQIYRQTAPKLNNPWVKTDFTRVLKVTGVDSVSDPLRQIIITSTVTYKGYNGALRTIVVRQDLYNWFPKLD